MTITLQINQKFHMEINSIIIKFDQYVNLFNQFVLKVSYVWILIIHLSFNNLHLKFEF